MKLRTKNALFVSLVTLGAGLILTGLGAAYGLGALLYAGIAGLCVGGIGSGVCAYKAGMDKKAFNEEYKNRDMLVEHSFDPYVEPEKENVITTEKEQEQKLYSTLKTNSNNKEDTINL